MAADEARFAAHRAWEQALASGKWSAVTWPEDYGGRGLDLIRWLIFEEEYWAAASPERANQNGVFLLAPTLMEYGTPEQKARFLPPMAAGTEIWAQAWSEPQAGSDLAAVRATATREGDDYVLRGHTPDIAVADRAIRSSKNLALRSRLTALLAQVRDGNAPGESGQTQGARVEPLALHRKCSVLALWANTRTRTDHGRARHHP